jgi:polar amino acid transport system ATP-binding protein
VESGHGVSVAVRPTDGGVLRLKDVRLRRGAREILRGVSFEVRPGEIVALKGPSGSGKTTVLRAIAGLEPFESGRVDVLGVGLGGGPSDAAALRELRRRVGLVFQFHCLFEHLTALANVCLAPVHAHGASLEEAEVRGRALLRAFGVEHRERALPRELSGGEAQRVAIARALAVNPPLLLMDEPTASLDPERRLDLAELLKNLVADGRTLVVATHDEMFATACATRLLRVSDGRVVESADRVSPGGGS